ncbi:MAG: tyrosine-type recombinase/integrase [Acidobacteriota bacterium]
MLNEDVESYLELRRAAGFDLHYDRSVLRRFACFASERGETHVVSQTAIGWSAQAASVGERGRRLRVLIRFARHAHAEDPRHQIPPPNLFGRHRQRHTPFIFSPGQICRLLEQANRLGPPGSLRPHTYATLFGLLSATGLRISEALNLRFEDLISDGLVIRQTKFRKSRLVPLHSTTTRALADYRVLRSLPTSDDHLFVSLRGRRLCYESVRRVFHALVQEAGIDSGVNGRIPQIHSLRHTFAVRALEACRCERDYVGRHLVALSTYLGHAHVADTYWYLEATPQLLGDIAAAWDNFVKGGAQ